MKLVRTSKLEDDVDALFKLPLAEFTGARNALAARLKKSGSEGEKAEAARVKALSKPSISAWVVNQLYWSHREAFDQLIASGERFHKAQTSGKVANMREAIDARRESLKHLSDLATSLLREAGHNPAPDTIHRVTTTLEGISAYASRSDSPQPGRLTADVDPPGFESFGSSISGAGMKRQEAGAGRQSANDARQTIGIAHSRDNKRQVEESRKAKIAAAKVSLQDAKRSLTEVRARAQSLEAAQKRAGTEAKKAEKQRRDAEETVEKAIAASRDAARRVRSIESDLKEATKDVLNAEGTVAEASNALETLLSSGRD